MENIHANHNKINTGSQEHTPELKNATLITGASSGIGLEFAKIFARHGHNLILVARSEETLKSLKEHLEKNFGVDVKILVQDLKYYNAPQAIYDAVKLDNINVNILVNNAGFGTYGKFSDTNLEAELEMIQVNITALTHLTKLFLKDMITHNTGRVLNVASTASFQPGPLMAVYFASKSYVLSFSEALAEELSNTKIKITALCPGPTQTNFQKSANIDDGKLFGNKDPTAKEVAEYGYDAMIQGKRVAVYGLKNKFLVQTTRFTPRNVITRIVKKMQE
jgi:short-subunit dehydrogenase